MSFFFLKQTQNIQTNDNHNNRHKNKIIQFSIPKSIQLDSKEKHIFIADDGKSHMSILKQNTKKHKYINLPPYHTLQSFNFKQGIWDNIKIKNDDMNKQLDGS